MNNRYDPPVPRMALRFIAAAMAVITMGALVALPAVLETADATAMAQSPSCTSHGSASLPTLFGVTGHTRSTHGRTAASIRKEV